MTDEQLQFAISQYLDGTLPEPERSALEERLKADPQARLTLAEFRRLNDIINVALPVPDMDWDVFSKKISAAVDQAAPEELVATASTQSTFWISSWKTMAIAASLLVCTAIAYITWPTTPKASSALVTITPPNQPQIAVLTTATPAGQPRSDVQIGPSTTISFAQNRLYPVELTVDEPARVSIAGLPVYDDETMILQ